jgi:hypothetical protein
MCDGIREAQAAWDEFAASADRDDPDFTRRGSAVFGMFGRVKMIAIHEAQDPELARLGRRLSEPTATREESAELIDACSRKGYYPASARA